MFQHQHRTNSIPTAHSAGLIQTRGLKEARGAIRSRQNNKENIWDVNIVCISLNIHDYVYMYMYMYISACLPVHASGARRSRIKEYKQHSSHDIMIYYGMNRISYLLMNYVVLRYA